MLNSETTSSSSTEDPPQPNGRRSDDYSVVDVGEPGSPAHSHSEVQAGAAQAELAYPKATALNLINPYQPTEGVDWSNVNLERNALLQYKDPLTATEFKRFLHRDLSIMAVAAMYWTGGILYWATMYDPDIYVIFLIVALCIITAGIGIEFGVHRFMPSTPALSKVRFVACLLVAAGCTLNTGVPSFVSHYVKCGELTELTTMFREHDPSEYRIQTYCRDFLSPFTISTLTCAMVAMPLAPVPALCLFVFEWIQEIIARPLVVPYYNVPAETGDRIAAKVVCTFFISMMTLSLMALRYRGTMNSFRQAIELMRATQQAAKREEEVDMLLCAMVPGSALLRLSMNEPVADFTTEATVLFSDMVQFTAWSSKRTAREVVAMLNVLCVQFDAEAVKRGVEKVKTIGDAYWAVTGLPDHVEEHAEKMCDFANKMLDIVEASNKRHREWQGVQLRIGIHSGELSGGILGTQQLSYEVFGKTSHVAEEVEKNGQPSRVTVSEDTMVTFMEFEGVQPSKTMTVDVHDEEVTYNLYVLPRQTIAVLRREGINNIGTGLPSKTPVRGANALLTPSSRHSFGSRRSSLRSKRSNMSQNDQKLMRQRFLAQRAKNKKAKKKQSGDAELTLEELVAKYSERRFKHVLYDFADAEVEAEYLKFARSHQLLLRRTARVGTFVVVLLSIFASAVHSGAFSGASVALYVLTTLLLVADFGLSFAPRFAPNMEDKTAGRLATLQVLLHHVEALCLFVAAFLQPEGSGIMTNDITFLHGVMTMLISMGNVGLVPAAALVGVNLAVLVPVVSLFIFRIVALTTGTVFLTQSNVLIAFSLIIMEKQYRQQFLENQVALYYGRQQEQRNREQRALLESIVPPHVIEELMGWLAGGLNPDAAIVKTFPKVCVVFIKLQNNSHVGQVTPSKAKETVVPASPEKTAEKGTNGAGGDDCHGLAANRPLMLSIGDATTVEEEEPAMPNDPSVQWLAPAHAGVDGVLKRFPAISKIKTIGELVMVAGPFDDKYSVGEAADQVLAAVSQIREVADVACGMHVGEIVGAVLGTNRLCFDIFGDTVNTSSRCLSTGGPKDISVSTEFHATYKEFAEGDGDDRPRCCDHVVFSEVTARKAKGKGQIEVHTVEQLPIVDVDQLAMSGLTGSPTSPDFGSASPNSPSLKLDASQSLSPTGAFPK